MNTALSSPSRALTNRDIAIAWSIWLARNRRTFGGITTPEPVSKQNCIATLVLWKNTARKIWEVTISCIERK